MAEESYRSRLAKLFSTKVVVRRTGKNRIKVYDTSKLQSVGTRDSAYRGRYTGVHTYKSHGYYTPNASTNFYATKLELYRDYEAMDEDPILASALDIYADESSIRSPDGSILKIKTQNDKVKQILHNLFYDILNIEFNLWPWIRNTCKYGDFYLALDLDEELGVVNVIPMSSYDVQRLEGLEAQQLGMKSYMQNKFDQGGMAEYNPYDVKFKYEPLTNKNPFLKEEYEYYEIAHFRLLSDTNFLPYGRSMLEPARKEFKRLALMEDAMMIHRIMRAPQRRVYKIAVGNLSPNEIDQYMQKIMDDTKKTPYIDEKTGQYNLKFNLQNMLEDVYIPVRGGDNQTEIDTLDGMSNDGFIEDVDYIKQKMMAALKIPRAFLGFDENLEGKCISPNTKIPLLNGMVKTVIELIDDFNNGVKNYVYSIDENTKNIVPGEIEWVGYTRMNATVVRVHLDNEKYIDCTPDHKFLLRDGTWIEAQYLNIDDSLMPHNIKYEYHKVLRVELLEDRIDTCDLTIKDYHNFGTDAGVIIHNSVLAAEDVRFARTIERIQSIFESELYKIAVIHLFLQGYTDSSLIDFELSLNNPSIVYERQRVEILNEKIALATAMKESKLVSRKYIYENVLNLSRDEWISEEELLLKDQATSWRMEQIANEGNDPKQSGEAKGTPHAIAQMHVAKEPVESDGGEFGELGGRPKSNKKFGTDRDKSNGRDPLGYQRVMSDTGFSTRGEGVDRKKLLRQLEDSFGKRSLNEMLDS